MKHDEFWIGLEFSFNDGVWRCTDKGNRVITAIRIDRVEVGSSDPEAVRVISREEAERDGWFNGPPYAVFETVFDEDDMLGCESYGSWRSLVRPDSVLDAAQTLKRPEFLEWIAGVFSAVERQARQQRDLSPSVAATANGDTGTCEPPDGESKLIRYHWLKRRDRPAERIVAEWVGFQQQWCLFTAEKQFSPRLLYQTGWVWDSAIPDQGRIWDSVGDSEKESDDAI